jgi:hypothetical protein
MADRLRDGFDVELRRARVHTGRLARLLTSLAGSHAIVFGRRIFLAPSAHGALAADADSAVDLLAHELTHVRQYRRYGMAAFLGRYLGEYLGRRFAGLSHREAYLAISFERDAQSAARAAQASPCLSSSSENRGSDRIGSKNG